MVAAQSRMQQHVNATEDCSMEIVQHMRRHGELELKCETTTPAHLHCLQSVGITEMFTRDWNKVLPDVCQGSADN